MAGGGGGIFAVNAQFTSPALLLSNKQMHLAGIDGQKLTQSMLIYHLALRSNLQIDNGVLYF